MKEQMLSELYVRQYKSLLSIAFQLARNEEDALDLMQDLAEAIARNDRPASQIQNPMAFFRRCLRNNRINMAKKSEREIVSDPDVVELNPGKENVESTFAYKELLDWLKKELAEYSPEMREAFRMFYFDGYSLEEVAQQLGISKNTLSQRFSRIRSRLSKDAVDESLIFTILVVAFIQYGYLQ